MFWFCRKLIEVYWANDPAAVGANMRLCLRPKIFEVS